MIHASTSIFRWQELKGVLYILMGMGWGWLEEFTKKKIILMWQNLPKSNCWNCCLSMCFVYVYICRVRFVWGVGVLCACGITHTKADS